MLLLDHIPILPKAVGEMAGWLQDGTIVNTEGETVVETKFEDIPKTWEGLFHGQNTGKLLTKIV
jgi:NADPH-dependent curcumin reductase CurA